MLNKKIKILFLADIIGKIGRKAVTKELPKLKRKYKPDVVIANAENLAHGIGFTEKTIKEMVEAGVDVFTSGNHAWDRPKSSDLLKDRSYAIIRPDNYPKKKAGLGVYEFKISQNKIIVVNLLGKVFIPDSTHSPFKAMEKILEEYKDEIVIVDFHGEATSEKNAFGLYFDGRVSAVIGTHTHVPTADGRIFDKGTAYVTDAGMIGYYDSVIGADKKIIFNLFLGTGTTSKKHDLPDHGDCQFNAIYLEIDPKTRRAEKIKRVDNIIKIN